jgi:hypothetical protein
MSDMTTCANCSALMQAEYCPACGQRRFRAEDRRFGHLTRQFFEAATDLDGRFWRSLRALLFQPGRLARDWFGGRRAYWMSPAALFLFANLIYFLAPALSDFDLPLRDHVNHAVLRDFADDVPAAALRESNDGQMHSRWTEAWIRAHLLRRQAEGDDHALQTGMTPDSAFDQLERDYDQASANYSKLLIVLHVPFLAVGLMLWCWRARRYYAEHFVVALHYFAFVLCFIELAILPGAWLATELNLSPAPALVRWGSYAVLVIYATQLLRVAYDSRWWHAALGGLALPLLLVGINVSVYRALQFVIVFALA